MTVRPGRVLTLAGPEVGAEKMRLRPQIRGPRLSAVPGRHAVARWSACGGIFTRGADRAASRAPPSSPPLSGAHGRRLADECATDVLPGPAGVRGPHRTPQSHALIKDVLTPKLRVRSFGSWKLEVGSWKLEVGS